MLLAFMNRYKTALGVGAIALLAFLLSTIHIAQQGFANLYYAAAIRSMLQSWHNFFFLSYDPAGFVTVDKPPLGFWIQALFVYILGYKGWVLLLPQALAFTASVVLLYRLESRPYGVAAGLISALIFALTPVAVAASRNNTIDSLLVFVLLLATWTLQRSAASSSLRWLLLCAGLVGLGFQTKMLQAYMILPAFFLYYVLFYKKKWIFLLRDGALALVVLLAVSFSWAIIVDSVPASERPFIGSSTDNSVMQLILGHNASERLWNGGGRPQQQQGGQPSGHQGNPLPGGQPNGQQGNPLPDGLPNGQGNPQPGGLPNGQGNPQPGGLPNGQGNPRPGGMPNGQGNPQPGGMPNGQGNPQPGGLPNGQGNPQPGGLPNGQGNPQPGGLPNGQGNPQPNGQPNGNGSETGSQGLLRLFNNSLAGQASWLLPFVLFSAIALLFSRRNMGETTNDSLKHTLFWLAWLVPMLFFFSYAGFFHRYYLIMLAPAIAALGGAGAVTMWRAFIHGGIRGVWLPTAVLATGAYQLSVVSRYPQLHGMKSLMVVLVGVACILTWTYLQFARNPSPSPTRGLLLALWPLCLTALLVAPAFWSMTPAIYGDSSGLPFAGPELRKGLPAITQKKTPANTKLLHFLEGEHKEGSYLVASGSVGPISPLIIESGLPAIAYGGFSGGDPILTVDKLKNLVNQGKLKYFLLGAANGQQGPQNRGRLDVWIRENGKLVPTELWSDIARPGSTNQQPGNPNGSMQLYEVTTATMRQQ